MVARPLEEVETVPMENANPNLELVSFIATTMDGDYYDCKKINQIQGAFAVNTKTADKCIQVSWSVLANGQSRVTIVPEENACTGYLVIVGNK